MRHFYQFDLYTVHIVVNENKIFPEKAVGLGACHERYNIMISKFRINIVNMEMGSIHEGAPNVMGL